MEHLLEQLTVLGSFFCHQETGRTIFCADVASALCARCTGMYSAFLWGVLLHLFLKRGAAIVKPALAMGLGLVALGGVDAFLWPESGNLHRILAGGVLGLGLALVALPLAGDFFAPQKKSPPPDKGTGFFLMGLGLWLAVLWVGHLTAPHWLGALFLLSVLGTAGLVGMIGALNAVILGNFLPWRPRSTGWALLLLVVLVGAEIAALMLFTSPRAVG